MINTATRPYLSWLESGKKTAEGRVNGPAYQKMRVGDSISFCDRKSGQYIYGTVKSKHEYMSFQEMLSSEGVSNMLPFLKDSELMEGVKTYNRFPGASRVNQFGCVVIGISVTKSNLSKQFCKRLRSVNSGLSLLLCALLTLCKNRFHGQSIQVSVLRRIQIVIS